MFGQWVYKLFFFFFFWGIELGLQVKIMKNNMFTIFSQQMICDKLLQVVIGGVEK